MVHYYECHCCIPTIDGRAGGVRAAAGHGGAWNDAQNTVWVLLWGQYHIQTGGVLQSIPRPLCQVPASGCWEWTPTYSGGAGQCSQETAWGAASCPPSATEWVPTCPLYGSIRISVKGSCRQKALLVAQNRNIESVWVKTSNVGFTKIFSDWQPHRIFQPAVQRLFLLGLLMWLNTQPTWIVHLCQAGACSKMQVSRVKG